MSKRRNLHPALFLFFLFAFPAELEAQLTEKFSKITYLKRSYLNSAIDSLTPVDSFPQRFQIYNPLFRHDIAFIDLGNIGSAAQSLLFDAEQKTGFDNGIHAFDRYLFLDEDIRLFKTRRAYTDLFYTQGAKEVLLLRALHSQNIKPNWNIGVDYNRTKSDGFYLRQGTSIYNTRFFNWYHSRDERYHLVITATFNRITNFENGGFKSDSLFKNVQQVQELPVNLGDEFTKARTKIKTNDYKITNIYRLGIKRKLRYYLPEAGRYESDTVATLIPTWVVSHDFNYTGRRYLFNNSAAQDTSVYPYSYLDFEQTNDSIQNNTLTNRVEISTAPFMGVSDSVPVKRYLMFSAFAGHQYVTLAYPRTEASAVYNNTFVGGKIFTNPLTTTLLTFNAEGTFWLTGYNQADYKVKGNLGIKLGNISFNAGALLQAYQPQYMQYFFLGNHNFWKNDFDKTFVNTITAGINTNHLKNNYYFTFRQQLINNYIYFDSLLNARQEAKAISITSLNFKKLFRVGHFYVANNITAQVSSNTDIIRIPKIGLWQSYYFQGYVFKKALYAQLGFDLFYYSSVKANAYDPETHQFYLQNAKTIGNYPVVDVFLTGQVQTFSFFLKMEHINQELLGRGYYSAPNYAMQQRAFRVGIGWKFFD